MSREDDHIRYLLGRVDRLRVHDATLGASAVTKGDLRRCLHDGDLSRYVRTLRQAMHVGVCSYCLALTFHEQVSECDSCAELSTRLTTLRAWALSTHGREELEELRRTIGEILDET